MVTLPSGKRITLVCAVVIVFTVLFYGCAATETTPAAKSVRVISEQQAKVCRFLGNISTSNDHTLISDPERDARNKALNRVAELGGNALRISSTNTQIAPSGVGSIFSLNGDAYACK